MKRKILQRVSLFFIVMMLITGIPAGVMAAASDSDETIFNREKESVESPQGLNALKSVPITDDKMDGMLQTSAAESIFKYAAMEGGISITGYTGAGGDVIIPSSIDGKTVLAIGKFAFAHCETLTSIRIPDSVTIIDYAAFFNCKALTSVSIPNRVTTIGEFAFGDCIALTSINIPNSVVSIGYAAFYECSSLTSITMTDNVTTIGDWAFGYCTALTELSLSTNLTGIGYATFYGCSALSNISLPDSISKIEDWAFGDCKAITSMSIPAGVTKIGDSVFEGCALLSSINVDDKNLNYASIDGVLYDKEANILISCPRALTTVTIPNSVEIIAYSAFYECTSLTSIILPDGVTTIGDWAFGNCLALTNLNIPNSVTKIGEDALTNCPKLTIYGLPGTYADTYANTNKISFVGTGSYLFTVKSLTINPEMTQYINTATQLTATGTGGKSPYLYQFSATLNGVKTILKSYGNAATMTYTPTKTGDYTLTVDVKDASGNIGTQTIDHYTVVPNPTVASFTPDKVSGQIKGTAITLSAAGQGGMAPYTYRFYTRLGTVTKEVQAYSDNATAIFTPDTVGSYTLCVDIKDKNGKTATKSITGYSIVNPLVVKTFTASKPTDQGLKTSILLAATGNFGKGPYQYRFSYQLNGGTETIIKDFTAIGSATFSPSEAGTYTLIATVKDSAGNFATKTIETYRILPDPVVTDFTAIAPNGPVANSGITLSATGSDGKTPYRYQFYYKQGATKVTIRSYGMTSTATFKPTKAGVYDLYVDIKDANGRISTRSITGYVIN